MKNGGKRKKKVGDLSFLVWVIDWMAVLVVETENTRGTGVLGRWEVQSWED